MPRNGAPARGRCKCRNSWGSCCPAPRSAATKGAGLGTESGVTTRVRAQVPQSQDAAGSVGRGSPSSRTGTVAQGSEGSTADRRHYRRRGGAARLFRALADCLNSISGFPGRRGDSSAMCRRNQGFAERCIPANHTKSRITVTPILPKKDVPVSGVDQLQWMVGLIAAKPTNAERTRRIAHCGCQIHDRLGGVRPALVYSNRRATSAALWKA